MKTRPLEDSVDSVQLVSGARVCIGESNLQVVVTEVVTSNKTAVDC